MIFNPHKYNTNNNVKTLQHERDKRQKLLIQNQRKAQITSGSNIDKAEKNKINKREDK